MDAEISSIFEERGFPEEAYSRSLILAGLYFVVIVAPF